MSVNAIGNTRVLLFQLVAVGFHHFGRQYYLFRLIVSIRVFGSLNVIFFVDKIRRNQKREKFAFIECFFDILLETFTRGKKLVVPDCNVAIQRVFMYQPHQLVRVVAVFFAVT